MTETIKWGICGTGAIAAQFVDALANVPDAEAIAVGSNDKDRSDHFGDRHQIRHRHGSYEELAADGDVDVIYVASTQHRHMRDTLLFLEAGRHVLCEKPFALQPSAGRDDDLGRDGQRPVPDGGSMEPISAELSAARRASRRGCHR